MPKRKKQSAKTFNALQKLRRRNAVNEHVALANIQDFQENSAKSLPKPHNLGSMTYSCAACGALMWKSEIHTGHLGSTATFSLCCSQGRISLPLIKDPPHELRNLHVSDSKEAKNFRSNIRAYNSTFAFAYLSVHEDKLPNRGSYTFRIQGDVCHRIGHLFPEEGATPKFAQVYVYDTQNEALHRTSWNTTLALPTVNILQSMLHECNPFVHAYQDAAKCILNDPSLKFVLQADPTTDLRRYDAPTASEVSTLIPDHSSTDSKRDIVLYKRASNSPSDHNTMNISETNALYDPLHYVLIFPYGHLGWTYKTTSLSDNKTVSAMQFYAFHLVERPKSFNILLRSGRLFQQYIVDQYAKIEQQRLNYVRQNQQKLRAELYQGSQDAVQEGDADLSSLGQHTILPSSFTGSPRSMHQLYQDSMAIVRRYGKPDLFITFTSNPKWPEITAALLPHQTASDRPDLVARVFHSKKQDLIHDIVQGQIFGKVQAYMSVIRFQKRGLPQLHLLLILHPDNKPRSPDHYDQYVSAEIPHESQTTLLEVVEQHMMHGPCGNANPNSPCMDQGKCMKQYPKYFSDITKQSHDGYPIYRRRADGREIHHKHGVVLDNRWVIPYNPYLAAKYKAYINVEICSTVTTVKDLYKYMYRGQDRIMAPPKQPEQGDAVNEIKRFIDTRCITPVEASWRLFHYELNSRSPAIQRLDVHLKDPEGAKHTTLTGWFHANQVYPEARNFLYQEFPEHYTWNKATHIWTPRKHMFSIGRMYTASPMQGERYYLRVLLNHIPGCTSFEDLRRLENGDVAPTFRVAALARGYLEDHKDWYTCLEAALTALPKRMRNLFATLLIFAQPAEASNLFHSFLQPMSGDIRHATPSLTEHQVTQMTLNEIDICLQSHNKTLLDFTDMPQLSQPISHEGQTFNPPTERDKADRNSALLNDDQTLIYNTVIQAVTSQQSAVYFLDGPGGTGKTVTFNTILQRLRGMNVYPIVVASSEIASELLEGGCTAHSKFQIPIPIMPDSTCNISSDSALATEIRAAPLIIWDEAPMLHRHVFEAVHRTLCDIMQVSDSVPFGGKVFLIGGDFRQVLPVIRDGREADIVSSTLRNSFLWEHVQSFHLTINMRAKLHVPADDEQDPQEFQDYLLSIGEGREPIHSHIGPCMIQLQPAVCIDSIHGGINELINAVFPDLNHIDYTRAILCATDEDVDNINSTIINKQTEPTMTFLSADTLIDATQHFLYPTEFLNTLTPSGLPPHSLTLNENTPVLLLTNLDPKNGLVNGTRLKILQLAQRLLGAEIMTGNHAGNFVFIPRIPMISFDSGLPFTFKRCQFPVKPAYAMTINKSQGQTLSFIGINLTRPVFSHGQLYFAMSRTTSLQNMRILTETTDTEGNYYTRNIVLNMF